MSALPAGSGVAWVSCASGPEGCIDSQVLSASDMHISLDEKAEDVGVVLRLRSRATVLPSDVGV